VEGWHGAAVTGWFPKTNKPFHVGVNMPRISRNYLNLPYNPKLKDRAKELRKSSNFSEALLWNQLKNKKFKGYDFDRQKIIGDFIVDFFCVDCGVVIEIDGESHIGKEEYDYERDSYLEGLSLITIHLNKRDVIKHMDRVMDMLYNHPAFKD
jgi:very-short-patch-repair endonuclease